MFELPEYTVLSQQINQFLLHKLVSSGNLGNTPHKFVWHNRQNDEFVELITGKTVGESFVRGRWLFIPLEPGYILLIGECGGKFLYNQAGSPLPKKYHLLVQFADGDFLTETTQMWGAMELYEKDKVWERQYIKDMRPTPMDDDFTFEYFDRLIDEISSNKKYSSKALLTQEQLIPGLGNACAQDILFLAKIHPKRDISALDKIQREVLFTSIKNTLRDITQAGGRYDEFDLFGQPGGYVRLMDKNAPGKPCPVCGGEVKAISYLGGKCYFCSDCQILQ